MAARSAKAVPHRYKGLKPWKPGQSGNPKATANGSRHKVTVALANLFAGEGEAIGRRCIEMALSGDVAAMRLCLERALPPLKIGDRPLTIPLPKITSAEEAAQASAAILQAVSTGQLTPDEGASIGKLIDGLVKAIEVSDIEKRLQRLEGRAVTVIPP